VPGHRPSVSATSASSRSYNGDVFSRDRGDGARVRDLPPRRNLFRDHAGSGSSRTGGVDDDRGRERDVTSPTKNHQWGQSDKGKDPAAPKPRRQRAGTYVKKPRRATATHAN
jgi:hypothetical protein